MARDTEDSQDRRESHPDPEVNDAGQSESISIYDEVAREGREELARPVFSLWWSGVAAGIAISLSVFCKAMFKANLPDADWAVLVSSMGYTVGFVVVILSRLQLFTENTITVILPLLTEKSWECLKCVARLWTVVFAANMVGSFFAAALAIWIGLGPDPIIKASIEISVHFVEKPFWQTLMLGIPAGFMIAALVWMLPQAKENMFWVIFFVTYFIGLGGFSHVVAGSTEAFLAMLAGEVSVSYAIFGAILPALIGNVIGGTGLFAILAYCQVSEEL